MSTPHNYNLGQNKKEQLTPFPPPKAMMKAWRSKNAPFWHHWNGGEGCSRCSIYFVQACSRLSDDFHVSNILRCIFIRRCLFGKMLLKEMSFFLWYRWVYRRRSCGDNPVVHGFPKKTPSRFFRFAVSIRCINHSKNSQTPLLKISFWNRTESVVISCAPFLLFLLEDLSNDWHLSSCHHRPQTLDLQAKSTRMWLSNRPWPAFGNKCGMPSEVY